MANITGDDLDNTLIGTDEEDKVRGRRGNDIISTADGNDIADGGDGDDGIAGGAGNDILLGGDGDDVLQGDSGDDILKGNAGADDLTGGDGNDILRGGFSEDVLTGGSGNDIALGGIADDIIVGDSGNDILLGNEGDDILRGDSGNDILKAGEGDDIAIGGEGADIVLGNDGDDVLQGDSGDDIIKAGSGDDEVLGGAGHDIIKASSGDDSISGGAGNDIISGGEGGSDIATYSGDANEYVVTKIGNFYQVRDLVANRDGTDIVKDVEFLNFNGNINTIDSFLNNSNPTPNQAPDFNQDQYNFSVTADLNGNNKVVDSVSATDADSTNLQYSIVSGNDANLFSIDAATGEIRLIGDVNATTPDVVNLIIQVSDGDLTDQTSVNINISKNTPSNTLFNDESNTVDFNSLDQSAFDAAAIAGNAYNALDGNDTVTLLNPQGQTQLNGYDYNATFDLGAGDDTVFAFSNGTATGNQSISGGAGNDTVNFSLSANAVNLVLGTNITFVDNFVDNQGFENIVGSNFNDILVGNDSDNIIEGGLGSDALVGSTSVDAQDNDTLIYNGNTAGYAINAELVTPPLPGNTEANFYLSISDNSNNDKDFVYSFEQLQFNNASFNISETTNTDMTLSALSDIVVYQGDASDITLRGIDSGDYVFAGRGDADFRVNSLDFNKIDGGSDPQRDNDTLTLDFQTDVDLTNAVFSGKLANIEVIDLNSQSNAININLAGVNAVTSSAKSLRIDGDAGNSVTFDTLNENWMKLNYTQDFDGKVYSIYVVVGNSNSQSSQEVVYVQDSVGQINGNDGNPIAEYVPIPELLVTTRPIVANGLSENYDLSEALWVGTVVTNVGVIPQFLSLSGAYADLFYLDDKELYLKANVDLSAYANDTLDVTVNADNPGVGNGIDDSKAFTIDVLANVAPEFSETKYVYTLDTPQVQLGDVIGQVDTTDTDSQTVTYRIIDGNITQGDTALFTINETTGEISLTGSLIAADQQNYSLTVEASDGKDSSQVIVAIYADNFPERLFSNDYDNVNFNSISSVSFDAALLDGIAYTALDGGDSVTLLNPANASQLANYDFNTAFDAGAGDDVIRAFTNGTDNGNQAVIGGAGLDQIVFDQNDSGVNIILNQQQTNQYNHVSTSSFEEIIGTDYADEIFGDAQNNEIYGGYSNGGGDAHDFLDGGAGVDTAQFYLGGFDDYAISFVTKEFSNYATQGAPNGTQALGVLLIEHQSGNSSTYIQNFEKIDFFGQVYDLVEIAQVDNATITGQSGQELFYYSGLSFAGSGLGENSNVINNIGAGDIVINNSGSFVYGISSFEFTKIEGNSNNFFTFNDTLKIDFAEATQINLADQSFTDKLENIDRIDLNGNNNQIIVDMDGLDAILDNGRNIFFIEGNSSNQVFFSDSAWQPLPDPLNTSQGTYIVYQNSNTSRTVMVAEDVEVVPGNILFNDDANDVNFNQVSLADFYVTALSQGGQINAGDGDDTVTLLTRGNADKLPDYDYNQTIDLGDGNDFVYAYSFYSNSNVRANFQPVNGGDGFDTIDFSRSGNLVRFNNSPINTDPNAPISFERIIGSKFNDRFSGDGNDNIISGGAGDDILSGNQNDIVVSTQQDNDTIVYAKDFADYDLYVDVGALTYFFVSDNTLADGESDTDQIINFENIQFADQQWNMIDTYDRQVNATDEKELIVHRGPSSQGGGIHDIEVNGLGQDDLFFGSKGNYVYNLDNTTYDKIAGGDFADTIKFSQTLALDLSDSDQYSKLSSIEVIDLNGNTSGLKIDSDGLAAITDADNILRVNGDSSNSVILEDAWNFSGTQTIDGTNYIEYTSGSGIGATLLIEEGLNVTDTNQAAASALADQTQLATAVTLTGLSEDLDQDGVL